MTTNRSAAMLIRTQPEIKEKSEKIFAKIGLSTSDAVNLFLSQVVITGGIPFPLRSEAREPHTLEDVTKEELHAKLQKGINDAKAGRVRPAEEVFDELRKEIEECYSR
ncbi:type II toxin-antitoxin system RelB/DinJ family antitoxin [Candidatus Saccharibacteria bacterium]|nr:type II toxin-antitoxin system RelB/DinJ family antitoxin [Candidatus Saccharibacteria bacterium]